MFSRCVKISVLLGTALILLTGCYPTGLEHNSAPNYSDTDSSYISPNDTPSDYSQIDNFYVNASLPEIQIKSASVIELKVREWDNDVVINYFLSDKVVAEKHEYDSDYFSDEKRCVYFTDDGYSLIYEPGRLSFRNMEKCSEYFYTYIESLFFSSDLEKLCADSEIAAFSEKEAESRVDKVLNAFSITNVGEPYVFSFDAETANSLIDESQAKKWTQSQEAYLLVYPYEYEGLPIATSSVPLQGTEDFISETAAMAIVTKDEIVSFNCRNVYDEKYLSTAEAQINYNAEAALNIITKKYNEIVLTSPVSIIECKLVYAPIGKIDEKTCVFTPMWQFDIVTTSQRTQHEYMSREYVNAQSGMRIY